MVLDHLGIGASGGTCQSSLPLIFSHLPYVMLILLFYLTGISRILEANVCSWYLVFLLHTPKSILRGNMILLNVALQFRVPQFKNT